ncbi:molybdate ABC transporter substrate-binding protein [Marinomonas sp.]|nr:molybdate ABC transporter substrate-binding protein [Marinomonas sp.]MDB4837783.1 molybdate ABC transporter substrate-binding protein [Marinomonas sp.]
MKYILPFVRIFGLGLFIFSWLVFSNHALSASLHIAVASNFIIPMKQIAKEFKQETGHSLQLSFASSGKLYAQILNGAPYDVFLSADLIKPKALIKDQKALNSDIVIYAKGRLALWSISPFSKSSLTDLIRQSKRLAIANPKLAPYGIAAEESLRNLAIWTKVQKKLVKGENIGQTFQFTYSTNADVGLVALSQVLSKPNLGHYIEIPSHLYNDINQAGVILAKTQKPVLAAQFMAFLMSTDIQAKIIQFGYSRQTH